VIKKNAGETVDSQFNYKRCFKKQRNVNTSIYVISTEDEYIKDKINVEQ